MMTSYSAIFSLATTDSDSDVEIQRNIDKSILILGVSHIILSYLLFLLHSIYPFENITGMSMYQYC